MLVISTNVVFYRNMAEIHHIHHIIYFHTPLLGVETVQRIKFGLICAMTDHT